MSASSRTFCTLNRISISFIVLTLLGTMCIGQEFRGTITGRVTDGQRAVVPGAKIAAVQVETGTRYETISGADGQYTLPFLTPSPYRVTVDANGFKRYVNAAVVVGANERVNVDIALELGMLTESVTVTADASLLQTVSASSGQVIDSRLLEVLPVNGGTPLILAQMAFGVMPRGNTWFTRPFDVARVSSVSMGGAPEGTNEMLMDGGPNGTADNRMAYSPPMDAVAELKVETFQSDASYGHTGGGTMNMVLKAGTNSFHGTAYEFNQVSRLAATDFFTNKAGLRKPVTRYNQFGVTAGGPLFVPRILDGRNRIFLYFAYEGIKNPAPSPNTSTVPTAAELNGDFSQLLALGSQYQIYDPAAGQVQGNRVRRQPLPGNVIPANRINPIARNYLQFYLPPNQPGTRDGMDNFLANMVRVDTYRNELGRIDVNLSNSHKMFFSFRNNDELKESGNEFNNIAVGGGALRTNWGAMLDDVAALTPTMVWNTRLNWTRYVQGDSVVSDGFDMTKLGFPAALAQASPKRVLPKMKLSPFESLGASNAGGLTPFDSFQIFSTLNKVVGNHSMKLGIDLRQYRESSVDYGYSSGYYKLGTNWTRGPLDNSSAAPIGQELASFMLGLPTGGQFDLNSARTNQANYYSLFLQDDFRVRPSLTLNLGIRYEKELPTRERFNRSVNGFDFTTLNPVNAAASTAYQRNPIPEIPASQFRAPGGLLFANPKNRDIYRTSSHDFSPRFGFAWKPSLLGGKTVLRGGFGLFFYTLGTTGVNQIGFSQTTSFVATLDGYLTPFATLSNPFPLGLQQPTGSSLGLATYLGQSVSFFNPTVMDPYSIRWTFNIQRELSRNLLAEVGYLGNHSVHLGVSQQFDYVPRQFLSTSPVRDQAVINRLTANVPNPFAGLIPGSDLNGSTVAVSQLLQPYPQFTGVSAEKMNVGSSYFHMLQTRLEKRFSHGLQLIMNFNVARLMERRSFLNDSDPYLEKCVASEDRPYRFAMAAVYEMPFGPGKALGAHAGQFFGRLIGGWKVGATYTHQPGPPLDWGNVLYNGGDLKMNPQAVERAFDRTRFNTSSGQQLAQNIRTFPSRFSNLRADGLNNVNLSLIKSIAVRESLKLQIRSQFFNALNHPMFAAPNLNPTDSSFGSSNSQANLARSIQMDLKVIW